MPSTLEDITLALCTLLDGATDAEFRRDEPLPTQVPADGLLILRLGPSPDPTDVTLGVLTYTYDHPFELEIFVTGATGAARAEKFDAIKVAIGGAVAADRFLGGRAQWVEMRPPEEKDEEYFAASSIKAGLLPLIITYCTHNPLQ